MEVVVFYVTFVIRVELCFMRVCERPRAAENL